MPQENDKNNEDDDDEIKNPFDIFKYLSDPSKLEANLNKLFRSKQFKGLFKDILEKMGKNFQDLTPEDIKKEFGGPIMYGFNINFKDGTPKIDPFGNIKVKPSGKPEVNPVREPLIEINDEPGHIAVIAEMPGISKDDIEIKATSHSLTISTKPNVSGRSYYKEIDLPAAINSDYAKARFANGILEIKLRKIDEKKKDVGIE